MGTNPSPPSPPPREGGNQGETFRRLFTVVNTALNIHRLVVYLAENGEARPLITVIADLALHLL